MKFTTKIPKQWHAAIIICTLEQARALDVDNSRKVFAAIENASGKFALLFILPPSKAS